VTPHLGKRKRGSTLVESNEDDGEEDELSPDREEAVRSIEKSRRVIGTVSPIREEVDDAPDELSLLEDGGGTARTTTLHMAGVVNGTPVSILAQKRLSARNMSTSTPVAGSLGSIKPTSRHSISRKSKSAEPGPLTPSVVPKGRPTLSSASRSGPQLDTPGAAQPGDASEDELSPPQVNSTTPRIIINGQHSPVNPQIQDHMDVDELSSPMQPPPVHETPPIEKSKRADRQQGRHEKAKTVAKQPAKLGRPRRVVLDKDDEIPSTSVPAKIVKRSQHIKNTEPKAAATPAKQKQRKKNTVADVETEESDQLDELSPDKDRSTETSILPAKRSKEVISIPDGEETDEYEEAEPEDEPAATPRPAAQRKSLKQAHHVKPAHEKPPRKRQRFLGPKHAISVMRIKGSTVRGITVADTTRTILEETIDHRLNGMAEKMQTSQDSAHRKELRGEINMSLSFKESLNEKLMDLQDANDVLSTNFKKMKLFKRDNAELRKDILTLQNNRQEVAVEHDDVQADYDAEKAKVDARNKLSEDLYSIEAAIHNGRKKARKERREDEGPELPLSMLLGMVGADVGSFGGGLLNNVKIFNGALERAAAWLEGRA
jgi:hypothetical protein